MTETKEKYVTEDMLERTFIKFGENFGKSLRKEIAEDTKRIVETSIAEMVPPMINTAIEASENRLGLLMLKHFNRIDDRLDKLELRLDNHILDCTTRGEHKKLEKRVGAIEVFQRRLA